MEIDSDHPVIVMVIEEDCDECDFIRPLVDELVSGAPAEGSMELVTLDVWDSPDALIELEVLMHPTVILYTNGHERARLSGNFTKRQLLRGFLPFLYADPDSALQELRTRLGNEGETLPSHHRRGIKDHGPQKISLLHDIPLFAAMKKRQLGMIARVADETAGLQGQLLANEGEDGDQLFLICEGSAVVKKGGVEIAKLTAGECFGEMALIDGEPRSATVELLEDSKLLAIHRRDFEYLLGKYPEMAKDMLVVMSRRLRDADARIAG